MKKALILLLFLLPGSLMWLSCGASTPSGSTPGSGIKYRAFVTNSVSSGSGVAGIFVVDAINDVRPVTSPISVGNTPGMMVVTPNRAQTVVFSGNGTQFSDNQLSLLNNAAETAANKLTLPGMTESFVVSPDSSAVYVAIPTAQVVGQSPGIMDAIALNSGTITGEVEVPSVHYLSIDNSGNRILGFSDNSDAVAVITPSNIGIPGSSAFTLVSGFDRPVAAFFTSDDTTAYVLNCGAECGGTQASIQTLDLTTNTAGPSAVVCTPGGNPPCIGTLDLPAGSVALVNGSTMYVAGTPYSGGAPSQPCTGQTTAATTCGLLTIVDLSTMTVTNSGIVITDGYHNRIALGANGQLFIGARTCAEISTATETRGCLSIYNTLPAITVGSVLPGGVLVPPANGDVTGIQPIPTRTVVYVIQNFSLSVYDVTIDALEYNPNDPYNPGQITNMIGQFIDVKTVDF
ncbi:MAG: hypothetical protein ACLPVW_00770 [Terriglobales bacterium]